MDEESGRFLARWARKKARARNVAREPDPNDNPPVDDRQVSGQPPTLGSATGQRGGDPGAGNTEDHNGEDPDLEHDRESATDLPDVEQLGPGSNFKPFMSKNVPADLRNQALKKLWASNPLYNHIDMLDDYCEDYTDAACAVPGIKTAYKVGRGFIEELAKTDLVEESGTGDEVDATQSKIESLSEEESLSAEFVDSTGQDDLLAEGNRVKQA